MELTERNFISYSTCDRIALPKMHKIQSSQTGKNYLFPTRSSLAGHDVRCCADTSSEPPTLLRAPEARSRKGTFFARQAPDAKLQKYVWETSILKHLTEHRTFEASAPSITCRFWTQPIGQPIPKSCTQPNDMLRINWSKYA